MICNDDYWNNFYKKNGLTREPSSFAQYVQQKYIEENKNLLELGCGNGRDSIFFSENGVKVKALDLSEQTISNLKKLQVRGVQFYNYDFSDLSHFVGFDYVYSRFTLHAVEEDIERSVFAQLSSVLVEGGLFLLEARSLKDRTLSKTYGFSHFRRYLDYDITLKKIENIGLTVLEAEESQGLSPYQKEDPFLLRIIAKKS